ncbi:MAG: formate dehydrogenase accessory sulfurtransferase FdhD [Coriobacteriia bacterium]|nr:formate dehydrogenase accessory sulfurtransferase FdhD [Coriobacteriia bacterium]
MEAKREWVLVFDSTHAAMAAQNILSSLDPFVIPTPRTITASCGISLRMDEVRAIKAKKLLLEHSDICELSKWYVKVDVAWVPAIPGELEEGDALRGVGECSSAPLLLCSAAKDARLRLGGDEDPAYPIATVQVHTVSSDGVSELVPMTVQAEHSLDVYVNEELTMRVVCTPTHLFDLIIGRLRTEGLIFSIDEIESIDLLAEGRRANVYLRNREADLSRAHVNVVPTCCTGNQLFNSYFVNDDSMRKLESFDWEPEWVFSLARMLASDTPLHRQTFGAHSCYLSHKGTLICCREDLGRHNALDKVVGKAMREGVKLEECVLYSSGRVPVDMVQKVIRARIPVLASKAVPTDMTIRLAKEFNLTLICSARPDSMKVLNSPNFA